MAHSELFNELVMAVGAAFAGGLIARIFRLPVIIGYILGGVTLSLMVPQIGASERGLATVAELGVALLMFIIGVELSLPQLFGLGRTAILVAILQIILTVGLGIVIGYAFGMDIVPDLILGFAIALSSTAVVLKSLEEHGQVNSTFGQVMLGMLVTQDLAVVLMLAVIPVMGSFSTGGLPSLLLVLLRSAIFLVIAVIIASKLIPKLLDIIAKSHSRELFALAIIAISFAAAYATYELGFSVALGAFIAGIIVGESEYTHQVFADIAPVRDIFAAIFFVSIGTTFRPEFLLGNTAKILFTLAAVVAGKFIIIAGLLLTFQQHHKIAFLSGIGLAQMGEFSFLIAQDARQVGAIGVSNFELIMTATLFSIILTPLLIKSSPVIYAKLLNQRWFSRTVASSVPVNEELPRVLRDHVIILGFGNVGQLVGAGLHAHKIPYVVIDLNKDAINRARARNVPSIFGDAANPLVIKLAEPKHAKAAVVALPDSLDTWRTVRYLQHAYPDLPVIARAANEIDIGRLYAEGADEVVNPRHETGLEILRHLLGVLNIPSSQLELFIEQMKHWELPSRTSDADLEP